MDDKQAYEIYLDYAGNSYEYMVGRRKGNVSVVKGWDIKGGELWFIMSDKERLPYNKFDQVMIYSSRTDIDSGHYIPPENAEDISVSGKVSKGNTDSRSELEKKLGIMSDEEIEQERLRKKANGIGVDNTTTQQAPQQSEPLNPLELILNKAKNLQYLDIPIKIDFNVIGKNTYDVLKDSFPEEVFNVIVNYYVKKINIDEVKEQIEKCIRTSLMEYYEESFDLVPFEEEIILDGESYDEPI